MVNPNMRGLGIHWTDTPATVKKGMDETEAQSGRNQVRGGGCEGARGGESEMNSEEQGLEYLPGHSDESEKDDLGMTSDTNTEGGESLGKGAAANWRKKERLKLSLIHI